MGIKSSKNVEESIKVYQVFGEEEEQYTVETPKKVSYKYLYYMLGVVIIVLAVLLIWNYLPINSTPPSTDKEKSIAVMPFDNESADEENEYFVNGMMEDIRNNLSKISDLRVISKTSTEKYRTTTLSSQEIGKELSINYLLEGTVQKRGNQVKIHAQLITTENDDHIWEDTYQRDITDIKDYFIIQSEIAQAIADALKAVITPEERELISSIPTENTEAYDLYLQAMFQPTGTKEDISNAVELLEKVVQIDPEFANAYAILGFLKSQFWWFGDSKLSSPEDAFNIGNSYFEKALELDPNNIDALHHSASSLILYRWDFNEAEKKLQILNKLDHGLLAPDILIALGRHKEVVKQAETSFETDPFSSVTWRAKILSYYFNGQKYEALQAIEIALKGNFRDVHLVMDITRVYLYLEMYNKALASTKQFFQDYKDFREAPRPLCYLAIANFHIGNFKETSEILKRLKTRSKESSVGSPSFYITMIYSQMKEIDLAFEWLEIAYEDHEVEMYWLKVEPLFDPLHKDARWQEMLDKVGFPE